MRRETKTRVGIAALILHDDERGSVRRWTYRSALAAGL
jgi:hypothetical protein